MSDIVGTSVCNGLFNAPEPSKLPICPQEQEVNDLCKFLNLEYNKYVDYKIIYDALEECVGENSELNRTLRNKVNDILLSSSVTQCLSLDECPSNVNDSLLGFCDMNQQGLNYIERNELQEVLKLKLDQKYESISKSFHKVTNKHIEKAFSHSETAMCVQMSSDDKVLIEFKNKLALEQEQYIKNLIGLLELLDEIASLRLKQLPQVTEQKIKECQLSERMNHLKSMLAQEKVRVNIFTETSGSLKAYKELIKDIKEQQMDCEREIEELKDLKEKYRQVSCKQYDDILKSYLQYKSSIEKKKLLYNCLKS